MSRLLTFLADVHARGLRVLEHPLYGGVHPVHVSGSYHYKGRAADINYGPPGAPHEERAVLLWACRLADAAGLNVIYAYHRTHPIAKTNEAHRDHLHVDDGPIAAYTPPGRNDALYARILAERPRTVANTGTTTGTGPTIPSLPGSPTPIQEDDMTPAEVQQAVRDAIIGLKGNDGRNILDSIIQTRLELKDRARDALVQTKGNDGRNVLDSVIQARIDIAALAARGTTTTADGSVNLQPVLDAIKALPAQTVAAIKEAL